MSKMQLRFPDGEVQTVTADHLTYVYILIIVIFENLYFTR